MLEVRTPAARPYVVSLARLISSSMLENLTIDNDRDDDP